MDLTRQVQEACAAVVDDHDLSNQHEQRSRYRFHLAAAIRALDLSHLSKRISSDSVSVSITLPDGQTRPVQPYEQDAAIKAMAAELVSLKLATEWQPIDTAPKDFVTEFDGWNGERVPNVCWAHPYDTPKGENDWCVTEYDIGWGWKWVRVKNLTHWMPLPTPPKPSE